MHSGPIEYLLFELAKKKTQLIGDTVNFPQQNFAPKIRLVTSYWGLAKLLAKHLSNRVDNNGCIFYNKKKQKRKI